MHHFRNKKYIKSRKNEFEKQLNTEAEVKST